MAASNIRVFRFECPFCGKMIVFEDRENVFEKTFRSCGNDIFEYIGQDHAFFCDAKFENIPPGTFVRLIRDGADVPAGSTTIVNQVSSKVIKMKNVKGAIVIGDDAVIEERIVQQF